MNIDPAEGGLPDEVCERILVAVPGRGARAIACMSTAVHFARQARADGSSVRWAESIAYNLREALDSVVAEQVPATGGIGEIATEWIRYGLVRESAEEEPPARTALFDVIGRVLRDNAHVSLRDRQLLAYLRERSGGDPLDGMLDPVAEYSALRSSVNDALHGTCDAVQAAELLDRALLWFTRLFTPPDAQATALIALARSPFDGPQQLAEVQHLISSPHQLRLFLTRLEDAAWLGALDEAGVIPLPRADELWPVTGLIDGLGRSTPEPVADLLVRIVATAGSRPIDRAATHFEVLRMASYLGPAGHRVVDAVVHHGKGDLRAVRLVGGRIAMEAEPTAPVVVVVARALITPGVGWSREWGAFEILDHLVAGLTVGNAATRARFLAGKLRQAAGMPSANYTGDVASLRAPVNRDHELVIVLGHYLVAALTRCRSLGSSTHDMLAWVRNVPGSLGERVTCQILAGADDVPVEDKIDHIAVRLRSATATGDDRDLVNAILSTEPDHESLEPWRHAQASPSVPDTEPAESHQLPRDWGRAWRWSAVLPAGLITGWQDAVGRVSRFHGDPSPDAFDVRPDRFRIMSVETPVPVGELAELDVIDAARRVAAWRPDATGGWRPSGARELARTLQALVEAEPLRWIDDPGEVIAVLREPVYVLHYLDGLAQKAGEIADRATVVLDAVAGIPVTDRVPAVLGPDDGYSFEPTWDGLPTSTNRLVRAFANADGDLVATFGWAWGHAAGTVLDHPPASEILSVMGDGDALHSAINRPWGTAFETVLALARWEAVHSGLIHPRFPALLDAVLAAPGSIGRELRAVLASSRIMLERLVPEWLDDRVDLLFRDGDLGSETFELTLKWSRPTDWLYERFHDELFAAAARGADGALQQALIAVLREVGGYTVDTVIDELGGDRAGMRAVVHEVPSLVQPSASDAPELAVALRCWEAFLDADRGAVPVETLEACGRWVFVDELSDDEWLRLTTRTAELTGGVVDYAIEIADRCRRVDVCEPVLALLTAMVDKGEHWERSYVQDHALEVLREAAVLPGDGVGFAALRTRLVELGREEAIEIRRAG